jgi:Zn-dependent protease
MAWLSTIRFMYPTASLITFSFPMGRMLGGPFRLSFLMPFVVGALMWRLEDIVFGAITGAIVLLSLLIHEFCHLIVARQCSHNPGAIVIWPLGGMQSAAPPVSFRSSLLIALAGPCASLVLAMASGWELQRLDQLAGLMNPFGTLDLRGTASLSNGCLRALFIANWCITLCNMIPVRPLDAGNAFSSFLNLRFTENETRDVMLRIGLVISVLGILAGFVFDVSSLTALSAFLLVLHIHEATHWFQSTEPDDSFLGYDFSEGYTSLDRSEEEEEQRSDDEVSQGILERWKIRREEERHRREAEERLAEEQQLDLILEKLHTQGKESLTSRELNILNRVSARLRQRNIQD